jgi:hypothetical protein
MIPAFDQATGQLPPGEHEATWTEISTRFGWNPRRRRLLDGLAEGLAVLAQAGCARVWINGSFVTTKEEPGDFDCVWAAAGVDRLLLDRVAPEILDLSDHRRRQQARFGGEFFPDIVEAGSGLAFEQFFQTGRLGEPKGIVVIDPRREEWA